MEMEFIGSIIPIASRSWPSHRRAGDLGQRREEDARPAPQQPPGAPARGHLHDRHYGRCPRLRAAITWVLTYIAVPSPALTSGRAAWPLPSWCFGLLSSVRGARPPRVHLGQTIFSRHRDTGRHPSVMYVIANLAQVSRAPSPYGSSPSSTTSAIRLEGTSLDGRAPHARCDLPDRGAAIVAFDRRDIYT